MLVVLQRADSADMYEQYDCRLLYGRSTVQKSISKFIDHYYDLCLICSRGKAT